MIKLSQEDSKPKSLPSHVLDKEDYLAVSGELQALPFECQYVESQSSPVLGYCKVHGENATQPTPLNIFHSPKNILQDYDEHALDGPCHKPYCPNSLQPERNFNGVRKGDSFTDKTKLRNQTELKNILEEIRFITDKIRNEVSKN